VPHPGHVSLDVFDAAGRHIRTLVDGTLAASQHTVIWDGRNDTGAVAAAGVYLYQLEANGRSETRRMVMVK
jgi:flagellar hook assembly protein FlgD